VTGCPPHATTQRRICFPGKTIFLIFMLVRLISARQVVLLCDHFVVYLFYRGKVYSQSGVSCFDGLPTRQQARYCPIWALIDVDFQEQGPSIRRSSNIWPIQASPPGPARWRSWSKQNGAPLLGMPLWNTEELVEGYVFGMFSLSAINPGHAIR